MESSFQLNLADVGTVIQFCSELEFIDENKIGIIGYSLGGHLACAATKMFQNNLYASALISAPYDLSSVLKPLSLSPFIILPTIALLRRLLKEDQSSQITKAAAISIFEGLNLPLGATIKFNKLLGFIDSVTLTLEDNEFYLIVNKFKAPVNYLMVTAENINEYKPEDYVSEYKTIPSLFIQGNKDTTVSNDSLENLYRSASTPNKHKIVLPDTNHFFNYPVNKRKALYGELKQFFKKYLNKLEKSNVA
jgi:alpha-beta hydrolase superfamily lysophospholipase